jgi:putative oxidoreductase
VQTLFRRYIELEQTVIARLQQFSLPVLRIALGTVFVWFGMLKLASATPVADIIAGAVPWLDPDWFVPALGAAEILIGAALLAGRWPTLTGLVLVGHLCGTFLVLVVEPGVAFQHGNPLLLTTIGEFVVKNVVLIAAALVLAARLRPTAPIPTGPAATGPAPA